MEALNLKNTKSKWSFNEDNDKQISRGNVKLKKRADSQEI